MDTKDSSVYIIEPKRGWIPIDLKEIFWFRELLYFLAWQDIKLRYKQTILGAGWAIIQPLFTMLIFTLFFGQMAKIPSDGIPYPIFSYSGLPHPTIQVVTYPNNTRLAWKGHTPLQPLSNLRSRFSGAITSASENILIHDLK
jgi:hypothetical protein